MADQYVTIPCLRCTAPVEYRGEWGRDHDGEGLAVGLVNQSCDCEWTEAEDNGHHDRAHDALRAA